MKKHNIVEFGRYYQSNDKEKEPIKWLALEVRKNWALLFSIKILDAHCFDPVETKWNKSEIKRFLNEEFYNIAFTEEEKSKIIDSNEVNSIPSDVKAKVFLFAESEIESHRYDNNNLDGSFKNDKEPTQYAISRGLTLEDDYYNKYKWWLRSTHYYSNNVHKYRLCYHTRCDIEDIVQKPNKLVRFGVVPVIAVKLENGELK